MNITVRRFLQIERALKADSPKAAPPDHRGSDQDCSPELAQAVLHALAQAYRPGDSLAITQIARAAAIGTRAARSARRYLRQQHRWPYRDQSRRPGGRQGRDMP